MSVSLSQRLRTETADLHRLAERSGIMTGLLRGRLDRGEYSALLRGLHVVYETLEQRLRAERGHVDVAPFYHEALFRTPSLEHDLTTLHGAGWRDELAPTPGAVAYANRIAAATPAQLVAHAYVRYLGDLSGGQALGRVISRALALPGPEGVAFYRFPDIADPEAFKGAFRAALDAMALDEPTTNDVVREAQDAFRLNVTVFEEVGTQTAPSAAPLPPPAA